jgi:hypothetical protein
MAGSFRNPTPPGTPWRGFGVRSAPLPKETDMNNADREQWIDNDEGLYNWWRSSRLSKRQFIRENREEIDRCISNVTSNRKPAHYLAY